MRARAVCVAFAVLLLGAASAQGKPSAVVAMGDSAASGESAGNYEPWQEWISGLTYDPSSAGWFSFDAVRQSFHANARGHSQLGRCLTEFYAQAGASGRCLRGADGNLHAVP